MAWRNLRSEISEMFTELSSGEHLSEYVQGLLAKRHAQAKERSARAVAYIREYRKRHPEKQREWARISGRRATLRKWAAEPPRICKQCWREFKRPLHGTRVYCSVECRAAAIRNYQAKRQQQYYLDHKEATRARKQRWYQQNREKILAKTKLSVSVKERRKAASQERRRTRNREASLAYYHANKARISEQRKQRRAAQKGTQP